MSPPPPPPPPPPPQPPSHPECRGRASPAPDEEGPNRSHGDENRLDATMSSGGAEEVGTSSSFGGPNGDAVAVRGLGGTPLDRRRESSLSDDVDADGDDGGKGLDYDRDKRTSSSTSHHPSRCQAAVEADDVSSLGDGDGNDDRNVDVSSDTSDDDSSFSLSLSHPMFHQHLPPPAGSGSGSSPLSAISRDGEGGEEDDDDDGTMTLQLSLPESFDDTFTIHGVPVSPLGVGGGAARGEDDNARTRRGGFPPPKNIDARKNHRRGRPHGGGATDGNHRRDRGGGGRRTGESVPHMGWTEREERAPREEAFAGVTSTLGTRSHPPLDGRDDDLTPSDLAVRLMHDQISTERTRMVDRGGDDAREAPPLRLRRVDELEHELHEATRARTVAVDRLGAARRELEARDDANRRLEGTVRELRSDAVELRERGRRCGVLERRCRRSEREVAELRRRFDETESALKMSREREEGSTRRCLEMEGKLRAVDGDAAVLRKEVEVLLGRVERAEADREKLDSRLREAQSDKEGLVRQLVEVKEKSRADCDARVLREVSQIRTEQSLAGNKDVDELRRRGATASALERENRSLLDARKDLTKELDQVRNELTELRATHQDLVLHQASVAADHEQSISKTRDEIKAKEIEIAKLRVARDGLSGDLKAAMLQNDHMRDQVLIHEREFTKLEKDAASERRRLEEELSRKNEQLETYLEAEIQIEAEIGNDGRQRGTAGPLSDPRRRIQHMVEITRKCANLKKRHDDVLGKLEDEKRKTSELEKKIKANEDMRQCIERENDEQRRQQSKAEIYATAKDLNAAETSHALDRRAQLETMLGIVDELKVLQKSSNNKDPSGTLEKDTHQHSVEKLKSRDRTYIESRPASMTPSEAKANMSNSIRGSTMQESRHGAQKIDLSVHTVHHKGRMKQHRPWHYSPALR